MLWEKAVDELNTEHFIEWPGRFDMINRLCYAISGEHFRSLRQTLLKKQAVVPTANGNKSTGSGNWTASSRTLVITMSNGFTANDVSREIIFNTTGTNVFSTRIERVLASDTVVLSGNNLPGGNVAVATALMPNLFHEISLLGTRFMQVGAELEFSIQSDQTQFVDSVSLDELLLFDPAADSNREKIVFCVFGSRVLLRKGNDISYGNLYLYGMSLPIAVVSDTDEVVIPRGPVLESLVLDLANMIRQRSGKKVEALKDKPFADEQSKTRLLTEQAEEESLRIH